MTRTITVKLPEPLAEKLYLLSSLTNTSVSAIIRTGILLMLMICGNTDKCRDIVDKSETAWWRQYEP